MAEFRSVYKKLLKLAKSLPDAKQRENALQQIRTEFRSTFDLKDQNELAALLQRAQSKIGYLKIVTPRASSDSGTQRFIYKNGARMDMHTLEHEEGARYKTADYDAQMKRHHSLLRRQYFMDRK